MSNQKAVTQSIQTLKGRNSTQISKQIQTVLVKFYKSAQVVVQEDCYDKLTGIMQDISNKQQQCVKAVQQMLWVLLEEIQALTQTRQQTIQPTDYHILQQSLQKAQSQVRKHIRIQQQLKLYLDGVEQKSQQLQKQLKIQQQKYLQLFETVKVIDQEKKQLLRKIKKMEEKNKFIADKDNINNHTKLKPHKSAKLITEQLTRVQNSMSMYKSRPTLITNHIHSKSKISDKSSQKQHKQTKIINNEKKLRMKQLDDMIEVNLSNDVHKQSYEQNNDETFIPTQQDVRIFKQMTKTVQMKQAYKRPVRKITKYKTESNNGKEFKDLKQSKNVHHHHQQSGESQCRQYRSVSMYK